MVSGTKFSAEPFYFFHSSLFVEIYIGLLLFLALSLYSARRYLTHAYIFVIVFCSYLMMGWALVPSFVVEGDHYWFFTADTPGIVSRGVLVAFVSLSVLESIRRPNCASKLISIAVFCGVIASVYFGFRGDLSEGVAYSVLLICFLALTVFVSALPEEEANKPLLHFHGLLLAVIFVGFLEFAMDVGPVRNFFRQSIETRALSTFHNPNWFALSIAPAWFVAIRLAVGRRFGSAFYLACIVNFGIIVSGSRSVHSVMMLCSGFAALSLLYISDRGRKHFSRIAILLIGSSLVSAGAGLVMSLLFGASDRFINLLVRLYFWPLYLMTDNAAMESIVGRAFIREDMVVDNAFLYIYGNGWAAVMCSVVVLVVYLFCIHRVSAGDTLEIKVLRYFAGAFVILVGFIGQVYWAFPVWPIIAVMAGCTLRRCCGVRSGGGIGEGRQHYPVS